MCSYTHCSQLGNLARHPSQICERDPPARGCEPPNLRTNKQPHAQEHFPPRTPQSQRVHHLRLYPTSDCCKRKCLTSTRPVVSLAVCKVLPRASSVVAASARPPSAYPPQQKNTISSGVHPDIRTRMTASAVSGSSDERRAVVAAPRRCSFGARRMRVNHRREANRSCSKFGHLLHRKARKRYQKAATGRTLLRDSGSLA